MMLVSEKLCCIDASAGEQARKGLLIRRTKKTMPDQRRKHAQTACREQRGGAVVKHDEIWTDRREELAPCAHSLAGLAPFAEADVVHEVRISFWRQNFIAGRA